MPDLDFKASREHWDTNLDPQNLGANPAAKRDLKREWAFYFSPEQKYALKQMPPLGNARCLEIGGGLGTFALWLAKQDARVYVIDVSASRLAALRQFARDNELADRIHCIQCAAEALPFGDDFFDLEYTKSVLIHTDLAKAMREARRTLKPGSGRVVYVEPLDGNPFANLYRKLLAPKEWEAFTNYFNESRISIVRDVFPNLATRYYYYFGFLAFAWQFGFPVLSLFQLSVAMTEIKDEIFFKLFPKRKSKAWFVVMSSGK